MGIFLIGCRRPAVKPLRELSWASQFSGATFSVKGNEEVGNEQHDGRDSPRKAEGTGAEEWRQPAPGSGPLRRFVEGSLRGTSPRDIGAGWCAGGADSPGVEVVMADGHDPRGDAGAARPETGGESRPCAGRGNLGGGCVVICFGSWAGAQLGSRGR